MKEPRINYSRDWRHNRSLCGRDHADHSRVNHILFRTKNEECFRETGQSLGYILVKCLPHSQLFKVEFAVIYGILHHIYFDEVFYIYLPESEHLNFRNFIEKFS